MKTIFIIAISMITLTSLHAQEKQSNEGLVLISSPRRDFRSSHRQSRLNYWNSRAQRYWSKCERAMSRSFRSGRRAGDLTAVRHRNRYSIKNRPDFNRESGLIKIN
jgi:hypothetical protein